MAEWIEGAFALQQMSGSISVQDGYKNHCGHRRPSDLVGFNKSCQKGNGSILVHTQHCQEQHSCNNRSAHCNWLLIDVIRQRVLYVISHD